MKKIALLLILVFLVGCGSQEMAVQEPTDVSSTTLELLLSSTGAGDFDSVAVSFDGIKLFQGENSIDFAMTTDLIELVALQGTKAYGLFQTSISTGDYDKIELSVKEVKAHKDGKDVAVTGGKLMLEKSFSVNDPTQLVFDVQVADGKLLASAAGSGTVGVDVPEVTLVKSGEVKPKEKIVEVAQNDESELSKNNESEASDDIAVNETKDSEGESNDGESNIHNVKLNGAKASPEVVTIKVGDTVVWENIGKSTHKLYAKKPYNYFRMNTILRPNEKWNYTFTEPIEVWYTSPAYAAYMQNTKVVVEE